MAKLLIAGHNVADRTYIQSVNCTIGRTTVTEQPSAGTISCELGLDINSNAFYGVELGDTIEWHLDDPASGGTIRVFFGEITDISITLEHWGAGAGIRTYRITGIGMLGALNRQLTNSNAYIKQYSGNRIASILATAEWHGVSYSTVSSIDTTNGYEIAATNNGIVSCLAFAQEAANSALGCLFEDHSTKQIVYKSYTGRQSSTTIALTTDDVLASSFSLSKSSTDVANDVRLTYGSSGASSSTFSDGTSKGIYGIKTGVKETTLHNLTDANSIAEILLASRNTPEFNLTSITIDTAAISDSLRQQLLQVKVGTQIFITDLPTDELSTFEGFIEGFSWSSQVGHDQITLNLSNYGNNYPYTLWNQLNSTDTWNTYATSTTKWSQIN